MTQTRYTWEEWAARNLEEDWRQLADRRYAEALLSWSRSIPFEQAKEEEGGTDAR